MAILTDGEIQQFIDKGDIVIKPYRPDCLGSNSYDIHLGSTLASNCIFKMFTRIL